MEDWKIKIAVLWLIYTAVGLGAGFYMLWEQGVIEQIIAGEIAGAKITPEMMIINAIMLLVPLVMAFLSLTLKDSINRWANIIVSIFSIGFILVSFAASPESPAAYAILLYLSMIVAAVLIVWYAWKSKQEA
ncbi:MAG: hypothetical protein JSV12_05550 [Candidatus Bathyarchaeota archaeon]|nr:MAG: hypothetical protein JSV12_05550 [Candidatus Bathyarchaeota archaeon]